MPTLLKAILLATLLIPSPASGSGKTRTSKREVKSHQNTKLSTLYFGYNFVVEYVVIEWGVWEDKHP